MSEAEQKVLARYPNARIGYRGYCTCFLVERPAPGRAWWDSSTIRMSHIFESKREAWEDAATRLGRDTK